MKQAARAIIIEGDKILVMHRNKEGNEYFTLVGGCATGIETLEQALVREVKEETGLNVSNARLVFTESHPEPYNTQNVYLCEVAPYASIAIQNTSEEALMNKFATDIHQPLWAEVGSFARLQFRTPQLQNAIVDGVNNGFPEDPLEL